MIAKTVNFHFTDRCNMSCSFCFARHSLDGNLDSGSILEIISQLRGHFARINFVGGEPCVERNLLRYLSHSKDVGLNTSIVSNGTIALLDEQLRKSIYRKLDVLGISVDSTVKKTLSKLGRRIGNNTIPIGLIRNCLNEAREKNVYLKVNTVVTTINKSESMVSFMEEVKPDRWKIFQMMPVLDNKKRQKVELEVTDCQFKGFLKSNICSIKPVAENNNDMLESYVMISPDGRFYNNSGTERQYSDPILHVGIEKAFNQIKFDMSKFIGRKGAYNYEK